MDKDLLRKKLEKNSRILYIKLGTKKDDWKAIENNKICIGFYFEQPAVFDALREGNHSFLRAYWKKKEKNEGTQTSFVNQMQRFFEDDGNTLWVTFANAKMYYCFSDGGVINNRQRPSYRKTDKNGWMSTNINGNELSIQSLSSALTKTQSTQNTIPDSFTEKVQEYIKRKILGEPFEPLERAESAQKEGNESKFNAALKDLMKDLHQDDFELLLEIIFSKTNWLRTSPTGGNQKTIDFAVRDFQSKIEAFVQVKTHAQQRNENGFEDYVKRLIDSPYKKLFFAYHSGTISLSAELEADVQRAGKEVEVWDLDRIFSEVCKYKLQDWVLWAARRC